MSSTSAVSHSQMTSARHPSARIAFRFRASRSVFDLNLAAQNSARVLGVVQFLQPPWRCQKQPCTKIATRDRTKTRSGVPGRARLCSRNRYPNRWAALRTASSGAVFRGPIRDIIALRFFLSTMSITHSPCSSLRHIPIRNGAKSRAPFGKRQPEQIANYILVSCEPEGPELQLASPTSATGSGFFAVSTVFALGIRCGRRNASVTSST